MLTFSLLSKNRKKREKKMTNEDDFPTEYDTIVLGTGMTESLVAAALSRIGQKVLHIDRNDYYSGDWTCFHLEALQSWIKKQNVENKTAFEYNENSDFSNQLAEGESLRKLNLHSSSTTNIKENVYIKIDHDKVENTTATTSNSINESELGASQPDESRENNKSTNSEKNEQASGENVTKPVWDTTLHEKQWSFSEIKKQWRRFNIDLIPKILYCRGPMVELLISSDVAKYCEFKTVTRILTLVDGKLEQVPCSRSDVFSSKQVSMIEKRMMMKFLNFAMEFEKHHEEYEGYEELPFSDYLKSQKLSPNVQHYIKQAIAMAHNSTTTKKGLELTQRFLCSLGRFGNTAFLWPVYGAGELPQCFCRMCAVFGGVYCLRRTAHSLIFNSSNSCIGIFDTEGKRLKAKHIVMEASYASDEILEDTEEKLLVSRCVLITDRSLLGNSEENITLLSIPADDRDVNITMYELGSSSYACPKGLYMIQMTCDGTSDGAEADFKTVIKTLFSTADTAAEGDVRPKILWSLFFNVSNSKNRRLKDDLPSNVFMVAGPDASVDYDYSIKKAREIFNQICPGEEFLPKAPNPEDIIYDDSQEVADASGTENEKQPVASQDNVITSVDSEEPGGPPCSSEGPAYGAVNDEHIFDNKKVKSQDELTTKDTPSDHNESAGKTNETTNE